MSRIVAVPFGIVVVAFAIANRNPVEVSLDPLPFTFGLPLYVVAIGALVVGVAAGTGAAWLSGRGARKLARSRKARVAALESELARLRAAAGERPQERLPPSADAA